MQTNITYIKFKKKNINFFIFLKHYFFNKGKNNNQTVLLKVFPTIFYVNIIKYSE